MIKMAKLHIATFEKVLKESKSGIRVSMEAAQEMVDVIGAVSSEIAKEAAEMATHAGRKTILKDDIVMAARKFRKPE